MSTINFQQTRTDIVNAAYTLLGILGTGQTLRAADMTLGVTLFNMMIKTYQASGLHLWAMEEAYLFLDKNTVDYYLGNQYSSPAKACYREDAVLTTVSSDAAASATSLTVGTTTGMTVGDYIGVVLSDNTLYWTTIATIPTSTTLTLTTGLSGATSSSKNVYTFTTLIDKPMRVHSTRRVLGTVTAPSSVEISMYSHSEYFNQPNKKSSSTPIAYYYQPRKTYGQYHIWPATSTSQTYLEFTMERGLLDLDAGTDIPDFPDEWIEVLTWQLALRLSVPFGREDKVTKLAVPIGADLLSGVSSWDSEPGAINIQVDASSY